METSEYEALKRTPDGTVILSSSIKRHPNDQFEVPFKILVSKGVYKGYISVRPPNKYSRLVISEEELRWDYPDVTEYIKMPYMPGYAGERFYFVIEGTKRGSQLDLFNVPIGIIEPIEELTQKVVKVALKVYELGKPVNKSIDF